MILHAKAIAIGAAVVAAVIYSKRSHAATAAASPLGPLGASTAGAGAYGVGSSVSGSSGLGSLLKSVMDAITAPANAFTPAPTSLSSVASVPVVALSGVQGLATVAAPEPAPYYSPPVSSSESFWAVATAPEPLPGVWGYQAPGPSPAAPAYGTPATAPSPTYDETGSSGVAPGPQYGSNLEKASREWSDYSQSMQNA